MKLTSVHRYRFRPGAIATVATFVAVALLAGLGFWQLDRAEQKRIVQAEYDARTRDAPHWIGAQRQSPDALRFHRVLAKGRYDAAYQVLIDNRIHQGRAGYHVLTPLRIADSDMRVLVNRGWVPLGPTRAELPQVESPAGMLVVTGVATVPRENVFMLGRSEPLTDKWQLVWQHMDMERYMRAVPFPVQPVVILLDPGSEAGGFVREWARLDVGIAVHQGYAFQWFMLALVVIVMFVALNLRSTARQQDSHQ